MHLLTRVLTCTLFATILLFALPSAMAQDPVDEFFSAVEELLSAGDEALEAGDYAEAREHYRRALEIAGMHEAAYGIAYSYYAEGRHAECITHAEAASTQRLLGLFALERARARARAFELLGRCLKRVARFEEAVEAFDSATDEEPALMDAHYNAAMALANLGDLDAAIDRLQTAIAIDPTHMPNHGLLAGLRMQQGERAAPLLAASYFLMMSSVDAPGRDDATQIVRDLLAPETPRHLPPTVRPGPLPEVDEVITQSRADRNRLEREANHLEIELLAAQFDAAFGALPQPNGPDGTREPVWSLYLPAFHALHTAGFTEAFVYDAFQPSAVLDGLEEWREANWELVEAYHFWLYDWRNGDS